MRKISGTNLLKAQLANQDCEASISQATTSILEFSNLSASYGNGRGLFGVSGSARQGEVLSLVGPNGAGKSTLVRALALLLGEVNAGQLRFGGWTWDYSTGAPSELAADTVRRDWVGAIFQRSEPPPHLRVGEFVRFPLIHVKGLGEEAAQERSKQVLEQFEVADREDAFAHELSGGLQQRVMLAHAIAMQRPILILDEATGALDADWEERVRHMLRDFAGHGGTVINISHRMGFVRRVSDRIILLDGGRVIAQGTVEEVLCADLPPVTLAYLQNS